MAVIGLPGVFARLFLSLAAGHDGPPSPRSRGSPSRDPRRPRPRGRIIGELEAIEQQTDPVFASPRDVFLDLLLSVHQLEAAISQLSKPFWP
jgi:hypothetical protein